MNSDKKIVVFLAGFILVGVMVTVFFPKEREKNGDAVIRIGAGDDISGVLTNETVEENENVMIYGPTVMNAEVICFKDDFDQVRTVGVSQGREQEKAVAQKTYPQIEKFEEITQKGILYSLEDGQVDAVIQDLTKAAGVPSYLCKPLSDTDYISYVIVVDKKFAQTEAFADFINSYNKAVDKLNKPEYLAEKLGVEKSWLQDKTIQFLRLEESED